MQVTHGHHASPLLGRGEGNAAPAPFDQQILNFGATKSAAFNVNMSAMSLNWPLVARRLLRVQRGFTFHH